MKIEHNTSKLILPTTKGMIFTKISEVSFFKSDDIYCSLNDIDGDSFFISKSLKWIENRLQDHGFYRVHNSYVVNIYNIAQLKKNGECYLIMECGTKIPISRGKRLKLMALFGDE